MILLAGDVQQIADRVGSFMANDLIETLEGVGTCFFLTKKKTGHGDRQQKKRRDREDGIIGQCAPSRESLLADHCPQARATIRKLVLGFHMTALALISCR